MEEPYEQSDYEILEELKYIPRRKPDPVPSKPAVNERQHWVQLTADMLKVPFRIALWKTINWPTDWIRDFYTYCMKNGSPPARLWYGLYKRNVKAK